jgi:hypothetical protein
LIPTAWVPYHRMDGELIGYLMADGRDLVVPMNLVGHPVGEAMDVFAAEQTLEDVGLSYLAEQWLLRQDDGSEKRVVIIEIDADHVVVGDADFALVVGRPADMVGERVTLPVPSDRLRPA